MKRLTKILLILFFVQGVIDMPLSYSDERHDSLIEVINSELSELSRLNKQLKSRNPNLLLRMAELYLERARVVKEQENQQYLALPFSDRQKRNKKQFFSKSNSDFVRAQKICYFILKKYRRFKGLGDVYYVLAFNAKEFNDLKRAKKYFYQAIKLSSKNSTTVLKAKLALAELLYNDKEYSKATVLYEQSIRDKSSKWWTKDAYNLSWCYYRINQKNKAINLMLEVEKLSKNSNYHDMSKEVKRDLAYFYTDSGKVNEALKYFETGGDSIAPHLIKMSKLLMDQGKSSQSEKLLLVAKSKQPTLDEQIEINNTLLNVYEKFGRYDSVLAVASEQYDISKGKKLSEEYDVNLKYVVKKIAATVQQQVTSKRYHENKNVLKSKTTIATGLFVLAAKLNPNEEAMSYFHAGETYFAAGMYDDAIRSYEDSAIAAQRTNDGQTKKMAIEGMMAAIGMPGVSKEMKDKYLIKFYSLYIKESPNSSKAFKIYQRLFNEQLSRQMFDEAQGTLDDFSKSFPKSYQQQEAMIASLSDVLEKTANRDKLVTLLAAVDGGKYTVTKQFREKSSAKYTKYKFESVTAFSKSGDKAGALKAYHAIYKDDKNDRNIKAKAAYNIAITFKDLHYIDKTAIWLKAATDLMTDDDLTELEDSLLAMQRYLYLRQKIVESAGINESIYNRLCKNNKSKRRNDFAQNAFTLYLALDDLSSAAKIINTFKNCDISKSIELTAAKDLFEIFRKNKDYKNLLFLTKKYEHERSLYSDIILNYAEMADISRSQKDYRLAMQYYEEIMNIFRISQSSRVELNLMALDHVARYRLYLLNNKLKRLNDIKLMFPEDKYQHLMQKKFQALNQFQDEALAIVSIKSGRGSVAAYKVLIETFLAFADEVEKFTPPEKSEDYMKSFREAMKNIADPLKAKASELRNHMSKEMISKEILTGQSAYFLQNFEVDPYLGSNEDIVFMERMGK